MYVHQMQVQVDRSAVVPTGHWATRVVAGDMEGCPATPLTPGKMACAWGIGWGRGRATP